MTKKTKIDTILNEAIYSIESINKNLSKKQQDIILLNVIKIRGSIDVLRFKIKELK